ncbi:secreted protein, partial [gut metagenome]
MKIRNYLLASFGLFAMTACSNDDEMDTMINETTGDAYMTLSIEMPNLGSNTRAIDTNGQTNAGTNGEQKITNLFVFVYNEA